MTEFLIEQLGRVVWPRGKHGRLAVLIYHRVLAAPDPLRNWDVDIKQFDRQMRLLKMRFNVLPLREAVELLEQGRLPQLAVSITFDDGYRDNHDNALPILARYDLPATFFIATGYLNGGCMFNDIFIEAVRLSEGILDLQDIGFGLHRFSSIEDKVATISRLLPKLKYQPFVMREEISEELAKKVGNINISDIMMSSYQVQALRKAGMAIGAHTAKHPILSNENLSDAEVDIVKSKQYLEELLGEDIDGFAYPNGKPGEDYRSEHVDMVMSAGFRYAVSTAWGVADRGSDRYQIPRLIPWDKEISRFQARIIRTLWDKRAKEV